MARALLAWDSATPGYHAMLGMQAFGCEEMGDYARAETLGRAAIELEPRDGWAQHAVAHVMEMQSRQRDGIAWMRANPENWTKESFLQIHNWWHLALFHYDLGEMDEVLALYDGPIYGSGSPLALNMVDASAILWRLHLGGVDVGSRWQSARRQLVREGSRRQLRLQRYPRDDGLRRLRPRPIYASPARRPERGDARRTTTTPPSPGTSATRSHSPSRNSATAIMPKPCV